MLTLPDVRVKQILFIQIERESACRLFFKNENIVFEKGGQIINQASCHRILAVFVIGDFTFTSTLLRECHKRGVSLCFLKDNFELYAMLPSTLNGNYLLRMKQYTMNEEKEITISRGLVYNKIENQIVLLQEKKLDNAVTSLAKILPKVVKEKDANSLLGTEGNCSKNFFKEYFRELDWYRRMPRVKADPENFLLDMGYTLLFNFIDSLLMLFGFDTYKGCYHKLFFQRKSLACDLVEPFRCIIDRQLLKSYRLKQIDKDDFFVKQGRYSVQYAKSQKYAKIFMDAIMDQKENVYTYIQQFYRFVMNENNSFPVFKIIEQNKK